MQIYSLLAGMLAGERTLALGEVDPTRMDLKAPGDLRDSHNGRV